MQTIKVTNNNAKTVDNIKFRTVWVGTSDVIKANARASGVGKVTVTMDNTDNCAMSDAFSLPAGKTLKATIAYKAQQCPPASPNNVFAFGSASVTVGSESLTGTCTTRAASSEVS